MLLPTVNLVNLNVSRILERASEIGVRKAFGASSRTLVAQFLVENLVLTAGRRRSSASLASVAGAPRDQRRADSSRTPNLHVNYRVFLYGLALALFFGVLSASTRRGGCRASTRSRR